MLTATTPAPTEPTADDLVADGLMSVAEVMNFLKMSRSALYVAMDRGELTYCKLGRSRRIPRREARRFAAASLVAS